MKYFSMGLRKVESGLDPGRLGLGISMFLAIVARTATIDNQEIHLVEGRQQQPVPHTAPIMNTLAAVGDEGLQLLRPGRVAGPADNDDEGRVVEGQEGLAAQGMTLDDSQLPGKRVFPGMHSADADGTLPVGFDAGQRRPAQGHAVVHVLRRMPLGFDDITKGGKVIGGQGPGL